MDIQEVKRACGRIDASGRQGTGYLIAPDRMATCWHVVQGAAAITVFFTRSDPGTGALRQFSRTATVLEPVDRLLDCAVLKLDEPISDAVPLRFAQSCKWKATWDSFGYPSVAKAAGLTVEGVVSDPEAFDDGSSPVLELTSPDVAAGMATPLHGFSGSPVVVDGYVVGHLKRFVPDPQDPRRPAFGKVWATRSACVHGVLSEGPESAVQPVGPELTVPAPQSPRAREHVSRISSIVQQWLRPDSGLSRDTAANVAAESLVQLGAPEEALNLLGPAPQSVRGLQLRALALAKTEVPDNLGESIRILEGLKRAGHFDVETGGILAGRYKQLWQKEGDEKLLKDAYDLYGETFRISGDHYPGVNAAATALWLRKPDLSRSIAQKVLLRLNAIDPSRMDFNQMASAGEAYLLVSDVANARKWYAQAAERCDYAPESVRSMRRQAQRDIKALGLSESDLDDVFEPKP